MLVVLLALVGLASARLHLIARGPRGGLTTGVLDPGTGQVELKPVDFPASSCTPGWDFNGTIGNTATIFPVNGSFYFMATEVCGTTTSQTTLFALPTYYPIARPLAKFPEFDNRAIFRQNPMQDFNTNWDWSCNVIVSGPVLNQTDRLWHHVAWEVSAYDGQRRVLPNTGVYSNGLGWRRFGGASGINQRDWNVFLSSSSSTSNTTTTTTTATPATAARRHGMDNSGRHDNNGYEDGMSNDGSRGYVRDATPQPAHFPSSRSHSSESHHNHYNHNNSNTNNQDKTTTSNLTSNTTEEPAGGNECNCGDSCIFYSLEEWWPDYNGPIRPRHIIGRGVLNGSVVSNVTDPTQTISWGGYIPNRNQKEFGKLTGGFFIGLGVCSELEWGPRDCAGHGGELVLTTFNRRNPWMGPQVVAFLEGHAPDALATQLGLAVDYLGVTTPDGSAPRVSVFVRNRIVSFRIDAKDDGQPNFVKIADAPLAAGVVPVTWGYFWN